MRNLTLDLEAIRDRCNELLRHDSYRFAVLGGRLVLRDIEDDGSETHTAIDAIHALRTMETLDEEGCKYGIPFALLARN